MRKKKAKEKLLALILMATVAVTMIPAGLAVYSDSAQAAAVYTYTMQRPAVKINGHNAHVTKFTVSGLGLTGTCCQAGTRARVGKTTVQRLSNTDIRTRLMYYYGYQKGYVGKTNKNGFLLCRALSWLSGNKKTKPVSLTEVKNYINAMPSSVTVPNRFECYFCDPTDGQQNFIAFRMTSPGSVTLNKTSTEAFAAAAGSGYSFEGIEYTVYDSKGAEAGKLICKANGTTNTLTLDTGAYTVRETKTNEWYELNTQTYSANLTSGQAWKISAADSPQTGVVHIKKKVTGKNDGNLAFSFRLVNTANPNIVYQVTTDAETGEAEIPVLQGTYRCEEVLSEDAGLVDLTGPQTASVRIGETCVFERENKVLSSGMLQISKVTDDGGSTAGFRFNVSGVLFNQGVMTKEDILDAANASVTDYDEDVYTLGEWKVSENDLEKLNTAAADRQTGSRTVTISNTLQYTGEKGVSISDFVETLSGEEAEGTIPQGMLFHDDGKVYRAAEDVAFAVTFIGEEPVRSEERTIDRDKTEETIRALISGGSFEELDVSDIDISAAVAVDLKRVEYVYDSEEPENSGYEADAEKQIKNKRQKTEEKEQYKLSFHNFDWYGAATVYQEIRNGELTGNTETTVETGGSGLTAEISEGITHGRFTIEEVMTDAQKKQYRQPQSQTKEITEKDGAAAFLFSFENKAKWTGVELIKTSADGNVSGITFRLEGMDSRGEKIDRQAVTDADGKIDFGNLYAGEYVVSETDFDPDRYENNDRLDGYDVPAQKLVITGDENEPIRVVFENVPLKSLYLTKVDKETQLFLKNAVFSLFEGEEQLALFRVVMDDYGCAGIDMISCDENSGIRTSKPQVSIFQDEEATSPGEGAGENGSNDDVIIVEPDTDTDGDSGEADGDAADGTDLEAAQAEYNFAVIRGLKEGKTYTLKEITAPTGYAASINYSFSFEDGQKLVLENAAPVIGTTAVDKDTKIHMSNAEGRVTIVDTVSYSNLGPGHKYIMSGVLAYRPVGDRTVDELEDDAEITEILKDANGKEITAQKEFVPQSESGTVDIEFTFDASLLDGKQAVAMEQLVDPALTGLNGVITVVASHEDIEDETQSIYFPEIGTKASAADTAKRVTEADGDVTITDTVEYSNIIAGKVYEMTGTLIDKDTGKPLLSGGAEITSSVQFRADKDGPVFAAEGEELTEIVMENTELVSGTLQLQFTFDGSALAGKQAVAFEKLTTGGSLVGEHSDIDDEAQTVYLPSINTTASTNGTDTISDRVTYTNLLPGESYTMRGVLMDKATGEELLLNGQPVTAQMDFVPQQKDGEITIDFPVDAKELMGKTAVVFETCYMTVQEESGEPTEIEVISHRDINNKAQTVTFDVPQTGQRAPWGILFPIGLLAAVALIALRKIGKAGTLW